jgi:hypothetical protein
MADSHPRIPRAITADRWAILPDALERIVAIAQGLNDSPESVAAPLGRPLENTRTVTRRGDVAIVPVSGPIFRYANLLTDVAGATSIENLARDFRTAVDDPSVRSIVLETDSPGGQVAGVSEFAEQLRAAAAIKPVIAYVSDLGASAAYWIASAASEIVARETPPFLVPSEWSSVPWSALRSCVELASRTFQNGLNRGNDPPCCGSSAPYPSFVRPERSGSAGEKPRLERRRT